MAITKITGPSIESSAITGSKIAPGSITAESLAAGVGGGPKISNVYVTDDSYNTIDDTAVSLGGGFVKLIGTGFSAGCQVLINSIPASSTTFVSSTEVRAQVPALTSGSYTLYLVNSDGGVAIRVNGILYSGTPTWVTSGSQSFSSGESISLQISATGDSPITYALQNGSSLPSGLSLSANGLLSGSVEVETETIYSFNIIATDAQNQDSSRSFTLTVSVTTDVEYLVVGGGGGGGVGGGGGGGGVRSGNATLSLITPVTVGAGGSSVFSGSSALNINGNGGNSALGNIQSAGGGAGATIFANNGGGTVSQNGTTYRGADGGSGGGSGGNSTVGNSPVAGGNGNIPSVSPSQGNNGGSVSGVGGSPSGGGGGAGSAGGNATSNSPGAGGAGRASTITGSSVIYGGGGGGGSFNVGGASGGSGGGGNGTQGSTRAANGTDGLGGGGGGNSGSGGSGNGGSGVVIIRYPNFKYVVNPGGGLSFTSTLSGNSRITTFTSGTGNIQFSSSLPTHDFVITNLSSNTSVNHTLSLDGNLVLKTPGIYRLDVNSNAVIGKLVKMWGAGGASATVGNSGWGSGGAGGSATAIMNFTQGTSYYLYVPRSGLKTLSHSINDLNSNFVFGAGIGGSVYSQGISGSGGGFAMISLQQWNFDTSQGGIILMAAGGGGGSSSRGDSLGGRPGTAGGGAEGQTVGDFRAGPGTQLAGGAAGGSSNPTSGSAMRGGNGAGGGAGGGGGYFGGGGGGTQGDGGWGGGGGSGFANTTYASSVTLYVGSHTTVGNSTDIDFPGLDTNGITVGSGGIASSSKNSGDGAIIIKA